LKNARGGLQYNNDVLKKFFRRWKKKEKTMDGSGGGSFCQLNCCGWPGAPEECCSKRGLKINEEACKTWVYPVNYPARDYQVSMVKAALLRNTLVCLPTGLGKTLIAAVLMYNFYRWYDEGQIIFVAPTRPLVAQQVKACHEVVGIPEDATAELSGSTSALVRRRIWQTKRVFYATPQTVENDIEKKVFDPKRVVLFVVDEAHKALGKYAYAKVVRLLAQRNCHFRVLALSATPGKDNKSVQAVVDNLRIAHVEVRTEEDPDVAPYTHVRLIEKVVCDVAGDLESLGLSFERLLSPVLTRLFRGGAINTNNARELSAFSIHRAREKKVATVNYADLVVAQKLLGIYDDLRHYGASNSLPKMAKIAAEAQEAQRKLQKKEAVAPGDQALLQTVMTDAFQDLRVALERSKVEHPKTVKLREILCDHFERADICNTESRAMVFTGTRQSVDDIAKALEEDKDDEKTSIFKEKKKRPLLRVQRFVGQGGMKQADQQEAVAQFQAGDRNVLVATSVAEEGLDIGSVDLCVFYDQIGSPIRLTQRMGRTGRKRTGRVVLLLLPGEERKFDEGGKKNALVVQALRDANRNFELRHLLSKRLLPRSIVPRYPDMLQEKLDIQVWHASQVAGAAAGAHHTKKRKKDENDNSKTVLVATFALKAALRREAYQTNLDNAKKGWETCKYRPQLGDGWRRSLRHNYSERHVVGDVTKTCSVATALLRSLHDFIRFRCDKVLYDPQEMAQHIGVHAGLVVKGGASTEDLERRLLEERILENDNNNAKNNNTKEAMGTAAWNWDHPDDDAEEEEKKKQDPWGWDDDDEEDRDDDKAPGKETTARHDPFGWDTDDIVVETIPKEPPKEKTFRPKEADRNDFQNHAMDVIPREPPQLPLPAPPKPAPPRRPKPPAPPEQTKKRPLLSTAPTPPTGLQRPPPSSRPADAPHTNNAAPLSSSTQPPSEITKKPPTTANITTEQQARATRNKELALQRRAQRLLLSQQQSQQSATQGRLAEQHQQQQQQQF